MKKTYFFIFLFILAMGFLFLPENSLAEIELSENEAQILLSSSYKEPLTWEYTDLIGSSGFLSPEKQAAILLIKKAIQKKALNYAFIEIPRKILITVIKEAGTLIFSWQGDKTIVSLINKIEKETVQEAIKLAKDWLLQNELRIASGVLKKYSYQSYKGNTIKPVFGYNIIYHPFSNENGEILIEFYSPEAVEPPLSKGSFGNYWDIETWQKKNQEKIPPFIIKVKGRVFKVAGGGYVWDRSPYSVEILFNEPMPEFSFEEPGFFEKYIKGINSELDEAVLALQKAKEKLWWLTDSTEQILKEKAKKALDNIASFLLSFSNFQTAIVSEVPLDILGDIEPVVEEIVKKEEELAGVVEETKKSAEANPKPINLAQMQEIMDDISEKIDVLNQQVIELVGEPIALNEASEDAEIEEEIAEPAFFIKTKKEDRRELTQPYTRNNVGSSGGGSSTPSPTYCQKSAEVRPLQNLVIFNEIAWMGTNDSSNNEWIELMNITDSPADISGWQLLDKDNQIKIILGNNIIIPANGFYLLERTDNNSVPNVAADLIYTGALNDSDEALYLFDKNCQLQDEIIAEMDWPAGDKNEKRTMERSNDLSWHTYSGDGDNGIMGTPKAENSEPGDEDGDGDEDDEENDITAPDVSFDLAPSQNSLSFTIYFEIFDSASETASVSGIESFILRWKEESDENWTENSIQEVDSAALKYSGETEFIGEDEKTYYFQIKAKDINQNESEWLPEEPVFTTIHLPKKILINEIQIDSKVGSGGTDDDWVELYNPNDVDVSLSGWSIQEHSGLGTDSSSQCSVNKSFDSKTFSRNEREIFTIPAKGFFLIVNTQANQYLKEAADMIISWSLISENTIYLVKNEEEIENGDDPDIIDKVGFGGNACFSEIEPAESPSEAGSIERTVLGEDTDNNKNDFEIKESPSPTNSKGGSYSLPDFGQMAWPMFQYNSQHTGQGPFLGPGVSEEPEIDVFLEGDFFCSSVIDSSGIIYFKGKIQGQESLYAFYPYGLEKWNYPVSLFYEPPILGDNGIIYFKSAHNSIKALNSENGTLKWEKIFENGLVQINPVLFGNKIYVLIGGENSKLVALNSGSGSIVWEYKLGESLSGADYSLTADKDGTAYFGHKNTLYAIDSEGVEKWTRTFESRCRYYNCSPRVNAVSVSGDSTVYAVVHGQSDWQGGTDMGRNNILHAIDPENPTEDKWEKTIRSNYVQNPVIDLEGNIYLANWYYVVGASGQSQFLVFNSQGEEIRRENFQGYGNSGPLVLDSEGNVYALKSSYSSSYLHIFTSAGEQKVINFNFKDRNNILSLGGNQDIYIPGSGKLYVVSLKP